VAAESFNACCQAWFCTSWTLSVSVTGELHQDEWEPLLRDADEYIKLQCCVAGEDLAEWIVIHAKDLKAVFDKHNKA
jgi:hypothetical protein